MYGTICQEQCRDGIKENKLRNGTCQKPAKKYGDVL